MEPFVYYFKDIEEIRALINCLIRTNARNQDLDKIEGFEKKLLKYRDENKF